MSYKRLVPVGKLTVCPNCLKLFTYAFQAGRWSSGLFCSKKCAHSYSTKSKRQEINRKVSAKLKGNVPWNKGLKKCPAAP